MNIESLREYCIAKTGTEESFPFGSDILVFKVGGKIYLLVGLESHPLQFNVKSNPEKAIQLREEYPDNVLPGYHMNKKHWNTVIINGTIPLQLIIAMIDDSYNLVLAKTKKTA